MSLNKSKVLRSAEKYVLQGKIPAAIDEYRKVVDADPADLTTINTLGDLYVRAGRIQDAITNFSRIADSYREGGFTLKAIAMLKKISKLDPTNIETAMKLANLYSQQGLLVEARQQYLQVADAYARKGETRKALEAYQKIADLDPANTSVRMKLGEIYLREGFTDQAHESFIMAGGEFLRKGDTEQALNANLKAISVKSDSMQALTAIATIYTQHGQIDRAINLLCDVFERNPGDVELLTILGRTYLQASMMDDAERTFLSLVELDRNRYHYLLEVGRRFLQMGDLDRAAEQIDGCLDVLIGKREEDKAIDFLRKILDRDMNHVGGLKRLVQIFLRIREDHNVIATLNSLVEAAMRKGDDESAIEALKELARMEPDEPMHLQRLYTLGVKDIVESGAPDVVRAGQMDKAAQECLELSRIHERRGEAARASDYLAEARQLNPLLDTSAQEMAAQTNDWMSEASSSFDHTPAAAPTNGNGNGNGASHANGFDLPESPAEMDWSRYQTGMLSDLGGFVTVPGQGAQTNGLNATAHAQDGTVAALAESQGFRYTDTLVGDADRQAGERHSDLLFSATDKLPSDTMSSVLRDELEGIDFYIAQGYLEIAQDALERLQKENGAHPEILARFAQLGIGAAEAPQAGAPAAVVEAPASPAREAEVAAVEKYLTPVANEQEADTHSFAFAPAANTEAEDAGEPAEIDLSMFVADGLPMPEAAPPPAVPAATNEPAEAAKPKATERPPSYTGSLVGHNLDDVALNTFAPPEEEKHEPFMIHKETGPLQADLIVKFNSSDLLHNNMFDQEQRSSMESGASGGTQDLLDSLVSNIDASFDHIQHGGEAEQGEDDGPLALASGPLEMFGESPLTATTDSDGAESGFDLPEMNEPLSFDPPFLPAADEGEAFENTTSWSGDLLAETRPRSDLDDILEELREESGPLSPSGDFETHFSLGLAYKDMDLLDDAIGEFQSAFRMAGSEDVNGDYIQCCNMLGVCFKRKQLPKVAIMWFERGLKIPHRLEDEYQALRYEIAMCYEELGELDKALDAFMEVYGSDVNYRETAAKIRQLQAAKNQ